MSAAHDRVIVLAAGHGSRMGGPKALMDVGGRAWWRWQMERLDATGLESVWVVSEIVRAAMEAGGADPEWFAMGDGDAPMFDSVVAGASALEEADDVRGVFVLPVDVPAPERDVWVRLADAGPVGVPTFEGMRGHPLYLSWAWVEDRVLARRGSAEACRLDSMIRGDVREVAVADSNVTANLNTPEDVEGWLAERRKV